MNITDNEFKQRIYDLMCGLVDLEKYPVSESEFVKNEFADKSPCEKSYEEIFKANRRLCKRLETTEDEDVECIINNFFRLTQHLCFTMYDYGVMFSDISKRK